MPSKVQVTYNKKFEVYSDALPEKIEQALEIIGGKYESYAKDLCPVVTGRLKNSITHYQDNEAKEAGEFTEIVGTNVEYAVYVELGHAQQPGRYVPALGKRLVASFVPGKPYMRPAGDNHLEEYRNIIERLLKPSE